MQRILVFYFFSKDKVITQLIQRVEVEGIYLAKIQPELIAQNKNGFNALSMISNYNITISLMDDQHQDSNSSIISAFNSVLTGSLLDQISSKVVQKLVHLVKRQDLMDCLLKLMSKSLNCVQEVILRLKLLSLLQQLLTRQILEENIQKIETILNRHEIRLKAACLNIFNPTDIKTYLHLNVQLPYLNFLRKMVSWQSMEATTVDAGDLNVGFCMINKMKDIMTLRKVFHIYGCYYPTHRYAINLYKASLSNIKKLWHQICHLVKDVTVEALQTSIILPEEYLFICAAEETQDLLIEFVFSGYFSKTLSKQQRIKPINLLKPEIRALELERKKQSSGEETIKCFIGKKDKRKFLDKNGERKTGYSDNFDEKINTDMQMQILDSILRLESLLVE